MEKSKFFYKQPSEIIADSRIYPIFRELKLTDDINDNQSKSKKSFSDAKIRCELPNITDSIETAPSLTTLVSIIVFLK